MLHHLIRMATAVCLCVAMIFVVRPAVAGGLCCALCGKCDENCDKVCRLIPTEKKITITCWGCESEDVCLPGPSRAACRHCEVACDVEDAGCCHCRGLLRKYFVWAEWTPCSHPWLPCTQPRIVTKKKLMKKTVTKTVPAYKWVVEDLCAECEEECETAAVNEGVLIPPPPELDQNVRILAAPPAESR
jgi:hypothetical protein